MRKLLLFPVFAALSVFGCGGGDGMPCLSCGNQQSSYEYAYCLYHYNGGYGCGYMSVSECYNVYGGSAYSSDADCDYQLRQYYNPPSSSSNYQTLDGCPNVSIGYNSMTCGSQTYRTVSIGGKVWMAENLNYNASGSKCYNNQDSYCDQYGRLYNWSTAMDLPGCGYGTSCSSQIGAKHRGICPSGWHIPSNADWDKLMRYVDGSTGTSSPYDSPTAGRYLKARSGWNSGGNGDDTYGFAALPGGYGGSDGNFGYAGYYGNWWSATEYDANYAYTRNMGYSYEDFYWNDYLKSFLFSVRCLQD
ncbi:hypothetical protein R83H12_01288 [Fibrobacteria bacterium R8-3-H12]